MKFHLRDKTATGTGNSRPATDYQTKLPKLSEDGVPLVLVEVLVSEDRWGATSTSVVEVEVPAPGGELPTIPALREVTILGPVVDVYPRKAGGLGQRWTADAVVTGGAASAPRTEKKAEVRS